uniref:Uncharacterized protein n=1 Tax=Marseillevirus LCMAC102 TaxID=2506603 RepID=A0A481YUU1_9VIRU|nr:MAG: hypothetical protein LCMAC102_00710 [Marseillevirus LCMAC102]
MTAVHQYLYFICPWVEWRSGLCESSTLICEHIPSFVTYDYELACKLYACLNAKYPPQSGYADIELPKKHVCMFFGKKNLSHKEIIKHRYYYTVVEYDEKRKIYVSSENRTKSIPKQVIRRVSSLKDACLRTVVQNELSITSLPLDLIECVKQERKHEKSWFIYYNSAIYMTDVQFYVIPHSGDCSEQTSKIYNKLIKNVWTTPNIYFTGQSLTEKIKYALVSVQNPIYS